jgi:hypothetical protein
LGEGIGRGEEKGETEMTVEIGGVNGFSWREGLERRREYNHDKSGREEA